MLPGLCKVSQIDTSQILSFPQNPCRYAEVHLLYEIRNIWYTREASIFIAVWSYQARDPISYTFKVPVINRFGACEMGSN